MYFTKLLVSISFYGKEWGEGGRISIFRKTLSVPENFVGQPFKVSMISGIENFCGHGGGEEGVSRIFVKNFMSHSAEDFHRGTLLCFRDFLVSENVRDKRQGRDHENPSKLFCLRLHKNFSVAPFSLSLFLSIEKFSLLEGFVTIFCRFFCLALQKNFIVERLVVSQKIYYQKNFWIRWGKRRTIKIFGRKLFVPQCRKTS